MFDNKVFSERLTILRQNSKLTQPQLGKNIGVSKQTISMIEKVERAASIEVICALADFFNVSVDYLIGRTDEPASEEHYSYFNEHSVVEIKCLKYLSVLNNEGQQKMLERAEELTEIPKYQKKETQKAE